MIENLTPKEQHQHKYGGGWVANTATVEETVYIGADARVFGNARVFGDARVSGDAQVFGNARVSGDAQVFGNARVFGNAWEQSPLYIQGSRHAVTMCSRTELQIGCQRHNFAWWKANAAQIGSENVYTPAQIKEYLRIIFFAARMAKNLPPETKS